MSGSRILSWWTLANVRFGRPSLGVARFVHGQQPTDE